MVKIPPIQNPCILFVFEAPMDLTEKKRLLRRKIIKRESMLVAFSGGVDSTLLAALALDLLGEKSRCVLLDSEVVPRAAVEQAEQIARDLGLALDIITIPLMENDIFCKNSPDRCYHCKKISAHYLKQRAAELGFACVADGMNVSDMNGYRPGLAASTEEGIVHPFIEAGITKEEIRKIARDCALPVWQKPSAACLSSRIAYGDEITTGKLRMIEEAESVLAGLGFLQLRVRMHTGIARIEVNKEDWEKILDIHGAVVKAFKSIGFSYVTLDLEGYRSGSMDEVL
jgi:uncharacterized protein